MRVSSFDLHLQFSYTQPPNLDNLLKRAPIREITQVTKCKGNKCDICKIIMTVSEFITENGLTHKINHCMNCNSKYVIYYIRCNCGQSYIGQTVNFRLRINLHKQQIMNPEHRHLKVSKHLYNCSQNYKVLPIYQMRTEDLIERQSMENKLITKYQTSLNSVT